MRQPIVRRFAIAATLALILSVARPGAAQARDLRTPGACGACGWVQQLWTQAIAALWTGADAPRAERRPRGAGALRKDGLGVGWPKVPVVSSGSLDATSVDEGHGLDPNG